jgi:hypothetical protein
VSILDTVARPRAAATSPAGARGLAWKLRSHEEHQEDVAEPLELLALDEDERKVVADGDRRMAARELADGGPPVVPGRN